MNELRLIFLGSDIYRRSGGIISPVYSEDGKRHDWGTMKEALAEGCSVSIRQATTNELTSYEAKLKTIPR